MIGTHRIKKLLATNTWGRVTELAWPAMVTGAVRVTMRTVDILVVGRVVGAVGVAAVGIADSVERLVLKLAQGLAAGTVALVSQHIGAGNRDAADRAMTQTLLLALLLGLPVAVAGWFASEPLFRLLGAEPDVVASGSTYLRIVLASAPARMAAMMAAKGIQAATDTRTPMFVRSSATVLNIALTVVLVPGLFGLPDLGVVGAAWGTAVGNGVSALAFLAVLLSGRSPVGLGAVRWEPATVVEIVRIGAPQVVERVLYAAADVPLNAILLVFGTDANAAFQIGRRVQQYMRMPARGFSAASSALVGTRLGADRPKRAEDHGRGSLALSTVVSVLAAMGAAIAAPWIAPVFVPDSSAIPLAIDWIRVMALALVFRSAYAVLRAAFQAAGYTEVPLYATMAGLATARLGTSWLVGVVLTRALWGVYLGVGLDYVVRAGITAQRFQAGRWKDTDLEVEESAQL